MSRKFGLGPLGRPKMDVRAVEDCKEFSGQVSYVRKYALVLVPFKNVMLS